jgi:hypothetical protein
MNGMSPAVDNYLKYDPSFYQRKRVADFGRIAREQIASFKNSDNGRWYSVDRYGVVRVHYWYSSGLGWSS